MTLWELQPFTAAQQWVKTGPYITSLWKDLNLELDCNSVIEHLPTKSNTQGHIKNKTSYLIFWSMISAECISLLQHPKVKNKNPKSPRKLKTICNWFILPKGFGKVTEPRSLMWLTCQDPRMWCYRPVLVLLLRASSLSKLSDSVSSSLCIPVAPWPLLEGISLKCHLQLDICNRLPSLRQPDPWR